MGVPKFFRWISERYPCLSELVREYQMPTFDNLYLDMNGIIHTCSHPNDFDPHFRISEDRMFQDIFHYIEILFQMIQPQKLFFMAVDGVAPRAKMNQQRGRRFRSAKEADTLEKKAQDRGEELPKEARFDSNCITPGTVFMAKLHEQLKYFVTYKISKDARWRKCKIILSGHETPGEGEHKIMDYIRYLKSQPGYDPNTRHCLYGLDADLIMLGMCTHEPHFSLLREEVKFIRAKEKRTVAPEEQTFYLLHLSLLREYLELEFNALKNTLPFPFEIEKIIDDWVLMGFLVGNDFIPPLPEMHIASGALPVLYQAYIEILPTLEGYINEDGALNLQRFQKYMEKLSSFDFDQFVEAYADLKYFEARTGRKMGATERKSYKNGKTPEENVPDKSDKGENSKAKVSAAATSEYVASPKGEENMDGVVKTASPVPQDMSSLVIEQSQILMGEVKQLNSTGVMEESSVLIEEERKLNSSDVLEESPILMEEEKQLNSAGILEGSPVIIEEERQLNFTGVMGESPILVEEVKQLSSTGVMEESPILIERRLNSAGVDEMGKEVVEDNSIPAPAVKGNHICVADLFTPADKVEKCTPENGEKKHVFNSELEALIQKTKDDLLLEESSNEDNDESSDCIDDEEYGEDFHSEFRQHKRQYYMEKLEYSSVTEDVLKSQAEGYVRAIQWNLNYYYNGVCSWSWFYPHHYAPYISDIRNFKDFKLEFQMGEPFLPFQQLLAVLPAASKTLLPKPYQDLMVDTNSPIIDYYPTDFKTDLNGKKQEWEAVVLIPFIDEDVLLRAMNPLSELLTEEEKMRNSHGPALIFTYTEDDLGTYPSPEYFEAIPNNHAKICELWRQDIHVEKEKLVKGPPKGAKFDVYFPGFPTMKHLTYKGSLCKKKVKVFEMPSRGDNMIIEIINNTKPSAKKVAEELIGKSIYVEWPHLVEAKVISVSSRDRKYFMEQDIQHDTERAGALQEEEVKGNMYTAWLAQRNAIKEKYLNRMGVEVGETEVLVYCTPIAGRKYVFGSTGRITLEKEWSRNIAAFALQATVKDIAVHVPTFVEYKTVQEVFPVNSVVFVMSRPHYGCSAEVIEHPAEGRGRVKVSLTVHQEPFLEHVKQKFRHMRISYVTGGAACQRLGISAHLFSRVSGTIYITRKETFESPESKINIGLNLKFNKKNEEIPGYTKKEQGMWLYSHKAIELVSDYIRTFPELFEYLAQHTGDDIFNEDEIFPGQPEKVTTISDWLKKQPHAKIEKQKCGAVMIDPEIVRELEETVEKHFEAPHSVKNVIMQVKPYLLYKSSLQTGSVPPDPSATYNLFDRVVYVKESATVPVGWKGTVIGIKKGEKEEDTLYDVVFDKKFLGGLPLNCSDGRGYRASATCLINLTYGQVGEQVRTTGNRNSSMPLPAGNVPVQCNGIYPFPPVWNKIKQGSPLMQQPLNLTMSHHNSAFASWHGKGNTPSPNRQPLPTQAAQQGAAKVNQNWRQKQQPPQQQQQQQQQQQPVQVLQRQQPVPKQAQRVFVATSQKPSSLPGQQPPPPPVLPAQPPPLLQTPLRQSPQKQPPPFPRIATPGEFNAVWNNLTGFGRAGPVDAAKAVPPPFPAAPPYEVNQSGTELLKKMLRIPEESTEKPKAPPPPPQQTMQPVSVQEMFERARAAESKGTPPRDSSCIMNLLKMFQLEGLGLPRYTYTENKDDNSVTAQVILPNARTFTGASANTREQAGENAARVALTQLAAERSTLPNATNLPLTNNLPSPPQQWRWPQNQQMPPNRYQQQDFQQNKQDWRIRNDGMRSFSNTWGQPQQASQVPVPQQRVPPFMTPQQQPAVRTPARTNWRDESRQPSSQSSPFVPLQAVKLQRSKSGNQQAQRVRHQTPQMQQLQQLQQLQQQIQHQQPHHMQLQPQRSVQSQQQPEKQQQQPQQPQQHQQQQQDTRLASKSDVDHGNTIPETSGNQPGSSSQNSSNSGPGRSNGRTPKSTRPKKSRIAANFGGINAMQGP